MTPKIPALGTKATAAPNSPKNARSTVVSLFSKRKCVTPASPTRRPIPTLQPPANPRLVASATTEIRSVGCRVTQLVSVAAELSMEPLSTTTMDAGRGSASTSDSRHAIVSAHPFQFTITTPMGTGCISSGTPSTVNRSRL